MRAAGAPRGGVARWAALAVVTACAAAASSCSPGGFADPTIVQSVRVLASSADKPYARPGDSVTVSLLAYDGRADKPAPMNVYWLPFVCENPADDAYYACFQRLAGGMSAGAGGAGGAGDGGAGAAAIAALEPGVDLTPVLHQGTTFTFTMPADAVTTHTPVPGVKQQYGLVILFNVACAGHVELLPLDPFSSNPQQLPIGCFDSAHNRLGADDYVFGFTRVYAYDTLTNANPVIQAIDIHANTMPPGTGFSTPHCDQAAHPLRQDCPYVKLGPLVPSSSAELNPENIGPDGTEQREQVWVDYFTTFGNLTYAARLLYDSTNATPPASNDPTVSDTGFLAPYEPGDGTIWMVVHDDRGGASWTAVPVHVCADGDPRCGAAGQ